MKTRIAVLVSGGGTNLQALINAQKKGILCDGEIKLVISNSEKAYALTRAKKNFIPCVCISRKNFSTQESFENEFVSVLRKNDIQLIVLAGFLAILSKSFTDKYPHRIINIHPALIPSFCGKGYFGLKVHEEALKYGVKVSGATTHFVNEIPDGGTIIMQKAVVVRDDDTPESLQQRIMRLAEWKILPQSVQIIAKKIAEQGDNYEQIRYQ